MFVDKILGDYEERYFGQGHKRTNYTWIQDLAKKEGDYQGFAALHHEGGWSKKKETQLTPHLSTFDGLVLSAMLLENYFEKFEPEVPVTKLSLNEFEIKAGASPVEDLNRIPVTLKQLTEEQGDYLASIEILNMKLKISLTHALVDKEDRDNNGVCYFSNHLKHIKHDLVDIDFLTEKFATCDLVREIAHQETYQGLSSCDELNISILEWLIAFSQLAQVLVYNFDDMARCDSDTLWMRTIKARVNRPLTYRDPVVLIGEIVKSASVKRAGDEWRILDMHGSTIDGEVDFVGNVAHKLPAN